MTLSDTGGTAGPGHNSGERPSGEALQAAITEAVDVIKDRTLADLARAIVEFPEKRRPELREAMLTRAYLDTRGLNDNHKALLHFYLKFLDWSVGYTILSDDKIASLLGATTKSIENWRAHLIACGYIVRSDGRRKGAEVPAKAILFVPPGAMTWPELIAGTKTVKKMTGFKAWLAGLPFDRARVLKKGGGAEAIPREPGECIPREPGGNLSPVNRGEYTPSTGGIVPREPGGCIYKEAPVTFSPVTSSPVTEGGEVGSKDHARAGATPSAHELAKACREEPAAEAESDTPAESTPAATVSPSDRPSRSGAQETPPPTPAPATGSALVPAVVHHGEVLAPADGVLIPIDDDEDAAAVIARGGVKGRYPDGSTISISPSRVNTAGERANVPAVRRLEVAQATVDDWCTPSERRTRADRTFRPRSKIDADNALARDMAANWASIAASEAQIAKIVSERGPRDLDARKAPHGLLDVEELNARRIWLDKPARPKLTPFGDRDTPAKANQHAKALSVVTANNALERAWDMNGGLVNVSAVHFDLAINGFDAEGLGEGWLDALAERIAIAAVREAAKRNPPPDDLLGELQDLAPDFPGNVLKDVVATAFAEPWKTGIEWPRYDPAMSPGKIADTLREKVVSVGARWREECLQLFRARLFYHVSLGPLGEELESAMNRADIAVNLMRAELIHEDNPKSAVETPKNIAASASRIEAERVEDVIAFIVQRCRAIERELKGTETFDWRPVIPAPLMNLRAAFGIKTPATPRRPPTTPISAA